MWIESHAAPSEHRSTISFKDAKVVLVRPPTTCQQYSFKSMENLSEHRDRANKMDSNDLRTTLSIDAWLREICQRWGTRLVIRESPGHDSLVAMPNQRDAAALARGVANRD